MESTSEFKSDIFSTSIDEPFLSSDETIQAETRNPTLAALFGVCCGSGILYVGGEWWTYFAVNFLLNSCFILLGYLTFVPWGVYIYWCYVEAKKINRGEKQVRPISTLRWAGIWIGVALSVMFFIFGLFD